MGNPFVHVELSTENVDAAKKFYKSVFDWKLSDMGMGAGMGNYTMLDVGKGVGGGMMAKQMPQQPTAWLPYVQVADVKKAINKARTGGANVVVEYQEIPGMGAFGVFVDPTGAALGVWETSRKPAAKRSAPKKKASKPKKAAKKAKKR